MKSFMKYYGVRPIEIKFQPSIANPTQLLTVTRKSDLTGKDNSMDLPVTEDQLRNWLEGNLVIQRVMPHLNPDQREFLVSGATPEEWKDKFG